MEREGSEASACGDREQSGPSPGVEDVAGRDARDHPSEAETEGLEQGLGGGGDLRRYVIVEPGDDVTGLEEHVERLSFVALHFPKFTEGRGYSHARLLRTRYGFRGTVLAYGDVLRDQLLLMHRSGINAFYMREDQDEVAALEAFSRYADQYQYGLYPT